MAVGGRSRRARVLALVAALVTQLAVGVVAPAPAAEPGMRASDTAGVRAASDGPVRIVPHDATGFARVVGAAPGHTLGRPAGVAAADPPEVAARGFLRAHQRAFGLTRADRDLTLRSIAPASRGRGQVVRFDQTHRGVPVIAGEVVVRTDADNAIVSVSSETLPAPDLDLTADVPADAAAGHAVAAVAKYTGAAVETLEATEPELAIFDRDLVGGPGLPMTRLVWRTEVASLTDPSLREYVLVDADRGGILLHYSLVHAAKNRSVCDNNNTSQSLRLCGSAGSTVVRGEGDPPSGVGEADMAYEYSGGFYDFLLDHFSRDSLDDAGKALKSTVRWCDTGGCPEANAFWTAGETFYGQGFAVDDVVGHEFAHGLTQYSANLMYYYQSGAINESLSDLYGELFDLETADGDDDVTNRWLVGEEIAAGAIRNMQNPAAFGDPDRIQSPHYHTAASDSGGVHFNSGVNNKAVYLLVDGDTFNGVEVSSIGAAKTLQVYYEAQTALMTSATDYADLADMLEQACDNLVGTHGITVGDCGEVADAVTATEMRLAPPSPSPTTLDAGYCPDADRVVSRFSEDVEGPTTNWDMSTEGSAVPFTPTADYATSGMRSFFGTDVGATGVATLTMTTDVPVPPQAYLRFAHAWEFDGPTWDGGVVEYSTNGGSTWTDVEALFVDNGYVDPINATDTNPLGGRQGYIGTSGGYTASRLDLSSLAGDDVRFRWRLGTDSLVPGWGWWIDDVSLFACDRDAPTFPGDGTLTAGEISETSTRIVWPVATDDIAVSEYRLTRDGSPVTTVPADDTSHLVTGLTPGTSYEFAVVAVDEAGRTSAPLTRQVTTPDTTAPSFPANGTLETADVSTDAVTLTWPAASDNAAVDHYEIMHSDGKAGAAAKTAAETTVVPAGTTSKRITGLTEATTYAFTVRAFDASGNASGPLTTTVRTALGVEREVARLAGPDRYETAARISADGFPNGASTVYIATGLNFPDALTAGPAAGLANAPILLVSTAGIPPATAAELTRLQPDEIVVLGGDAAVPATVAQQLDAFASGGVTRVSGPDRYATAVEVSERSFAPGVPVAYVATGGNFPDALAGAAAAGRDEGPILLVPRGEVPDVVAAELARLAPGRIVILGGASAVSDAVEAELATFTAGGVSRLQGADRYVTAAAIAGSFDAGTEVVYVATGNNFPDALTGTPPAVVAGGPIMLVPGGSLPDVVATELGRLRPRRIVVLGGTAVVTDTVEQALESYLAD